jgi:hypothetical protein
MKNKNLIRMKNYLLCYNCASRIYILVSKRKSSETKYEWPSREFERRKDSRCVPSCPSESLFGMLCLMLWSHWFELQRKRKEIVVLIGKAKMKSTSYYHTRVFICGNLKKRIKRVCMWKFDNHMCYYLHGWVGDFVNGMVG